MREDPMYQAPKSKVIGNRVNSSANSSITADDSSPSLNIIATANAAIGNPDAGSNPNGPPPAAAASVQTTALSHVLRTTTRINSKPPRPPSVNSKASSAMKTIWLR